jgi:hypothetical protein
VPGSGLTVINVESNVSDAWVEVLPFDLTQDGGGFANFYRAFSNGETVTLTAEATHGQKNFRRWIVDGVAQPMGQLTIQLSADGGQSTAVAKYYTPMKPGDMGDQQGGGVGDLQR